MRFVIDIENDVMPACSLRVVLGYQFLCNFDKMNFMPYNKEELLSLPAEEKIALAEELWSSVEDDQLPSSQEEFAFAEERLKLHRENPEDGMSVEEFKKYFSDKHGLQYPD